MGLSQYDSSHVLSRLKGIETQLYRCFDDALWHCSHVLSRLKGIETLGYCQINSYTSQRGSHVLSRLKGIETFHQRSVLQQQGFLFTRAFPFEGN